jgi:hypothetical protein
LTTSRTLIRLACFGVSVMLLATPMSSRAEARACHVARAAQQQDPKAREITAELFRSADNATITLRAVFPEDTPGVKVSLFNLLGRIVEVHPTTVALKGKNEFAFRTRGLPNGPYIVVLEAAGQRIINKVMLSR